MTAVGDLHCAAGCTLGDFAAEWIVFLTGLTLAGSVLWSDYLFDFALAYIVGIVFQYSAIAPIRNLSGWAGLLAAIKADSISLAAFEIGMFAWMGLTHELLFKPPLKPDSPVYWFMMQIAMLVGFATAYPANWWLIRKKLKEAM